jgi:hypothetical protein
MTPTKSQLGRALLECLEDVESLVRHAHSVALQQQKALVDNDAEAIALSTYAQDEVMRRILESDQRAAAVASSLASSAGLNPTEANTEELAEAAGFPYDTAIRETVRRVAELSARVQETNEQNRLLLKNGLDIIACCLRTIASEGSPGAYKRDAALAPTDPSALSLDSKA